MDAEYPFDEAYGYETVHVHDADLHRAFKIRAEGCLKPRVDYNIALRASPTARKYA